MSMRARARNTNDQEILVCTMKVLYYGHTAVWIRDSDRKLCVA